MAKKHKKQKQPKPMIERLFKLTGDYVAEGAPDRGMVDVIYELTRFTKHIQDWAVSTGHIAHYNAAYYCAMNGLPPPVLTTENVQAMNEGFTKNKH